MNTQLRRLMIQGMSRKEAEARLAEFQAKDRADAVRNAKMVKTYYSDTLKKQVTVPDAN